MRVSEFTELSFYPNVQDVTTRHLDMLYIDARSMLRLPLRSIGIDGGCNFASVEYMCNLIAGISRLFYNPRRPVRRGGDGSEDRFKDVVQSYFPPESGSNARSNAEILYEVFRNPLTHSLGVRDQPSRRQVYVEKTPLNEDEIEALELTPIRPLGLPSAVRVEPSRITVNAVSLYWSAFHMFRNLIRDRDQATRTEQRFAAGQFIVYP